MLKLVSQFDNEKMRASAATPTCGPCCCCCCCCVVTTITAPIISSRAFGKAVGSIHKKVKKKDELYFLRWKKFFAYAAGFLLPILAVIMGWIVAIQIDPILDYKLGRCMYCKDDADIAEIILMLMLSLYIFTIFKINKIFKVRLKILFYIFLLSPIFFFGEMYVWLYFIGI